MRAGGLEERKRKDVGPPFEIQMGSQKNSNPATGLRAIADAPVFTARILNGEIFFAFRIHLSCERNRRFRIGRDCIGFRIRVVVQNAIAARWTFKLQKRDVTYFRCVRAFYKYSLLPRAGLSWVSFFQKCQCARKEMKVLRV